MATFIQVNIYNQTLETLKSRGLDLQSILKTIGCPDTWVTEIPVIPAPKNPEFSSSEKAEIPVSSHAPPISSTVTVTSSRNEPAELQEKRPFKSISAEIGYVQPLNLMDALKMSNPETTTVGEALQIARARKGFRGLFDDWDPTANLDMASTSAEIPSDPTGLIVPKEEILDETDEINEDAGDEFSANSQLIQGLFNNQQAFPNEESEEHTRATRRKAPEDSEGSNSNYVITCSFPGCGLQYNWRVKYGKLRLLDHALTHSNRKIPCKLCGFECTNVRRMRSHYSKIHPNDRVEGYGMKALVSGDFSFKNDEGADGDHDDDEIKHLWNTCYAEWIHVVGHAGGFVEGEKFKRMSKRRKLDRESHSFQ